MFVLDENIAIDMWTYLLNRYESEVKGDNSYGLTGWIMVVLGEKIGDKKISDIILNNAIMKKSFFSLQCKATDITAKYIISPKISSNELHEADELLHLLYNNKYRSDNWYKIMDATIPNKRDGEITPEAYELLEIWCDKVDNKNNRAKLSIRLLDHFN